MVTILVVVSVLGCVNEPSQAPTETTTEPMRMQAEEPLPIVIVSERGGFIPEGVEYDMTNGRLLTGSLSEGSVYEIHTDGQLTEIVKDDALVSSVGIEVDEVRDRLLVTNSDRSVFDGNNIGQAKLGVYELASGTRIAMVDLTAAVERASDDDAYFANDVAVADDGTAYVTDTRMGLIYQVTEDYRPSVLLRFDDGGSGPNGIVHHPAGYLLVARGSALWKVPLGDPIAATEVILSEGITGQDGMVWTRMRLAIVSNNENRVVALTSADEWETADVVGVAVFEEQATTAAVVGDHVYVVHPHFGDDTPPSVERVIFE